MKTGIYTTRHINEKLFSYIYRQGQSTMNSIPVLISKDRTLSVGLEPTTYVAQYRESYISKSQLENRAVTQPKPGVAVRCLI